MPKITCVAAEDVPYVSARQQIAESGGDGSIHETPEVTKDTQEIREYFRGDADSPSLIEVRASPDKPAVPHAHGVDEIVYVLAGALHIGKNVYGPESAVYIPANTLYSFHVGPEGVRYLNFRPHYDDSYIMKDKFMEMRDSRQGLS
jgi:hypothetical protein